jgi:hypothetical protein|tara:strand:+ start:857 stop:1297 length:441 start_codon:yes stop_codon:yes gene_type:complete
VLGFLIEKITHLGKDLYLLKIIFLGMGLTLTSTEREQMTNIHLANYIKDKWIDRLYCTLHGKVYLIQADGSEYNGAIKTKKFSGKTFSFTEDGRWFDRSGLPVEKPSEADTKAEISILKSEIKKREEDKKFQDLKNKITNNLKGDR